MKKIEHFNSSSESDTLDFAYKLAKRIKVGTVVCLDGELGVGKTVFAKGFARGLGVEDEITSPTFTIVQSYKGEVLFHHFDVYRISDISEFEEIGYEEFFYGNGICLVEWSKLVEEAIPKNAVKATISKDIEKGFDYREITCEIVLERLKD